PGGLVPAEGGREAAAPDRVSPGTLRWGILGPGRIAPRLVRGIAATPRCTLVAVAGRDLARARAFADRHGIPDAYGSYDELLESDVDVVYVALPNHLHAPWTIRALRAGKHVLCEKPLALSVDEVDAIAEAADASGRIAVEAFMYLHHPQIERALEIVAAGELGRLELVHASFSFFLTYPGDPRLEPEMGGGSLWDVGCYAVSVTRRISGEEPDGHAAFARFDERAVDRTFIGQLRFPSGLLAQVDSGFASADRQRVEIVGGEGTLVLDAPFLNGPDGPAPGMTLTRGDEATRIEVPSIDQYAAEVADLAAAILDGRRPRVDLGFSRGTIAALVELDRLARANAGLPRRY
ncbi:MAG TPA: Gfo/Idh/MocA family oxidoreductase, partial [Candidatus Limnocylindrales bacterium]|nr:Gfo/Idh/MocA family oxidoreductase [Candidatus Limnocylindrales bacterium]